MSRSSARVVSYDLRPSKQTERRILLDLLKIAGDCGCGIRDYRYVGMGANRFYDFLLMHKYIGIKNMISLEQDSKMFKRAQLNVPYTFIDVRHQKVDRFIAEDTFVERSILWFDYDETISQTMIRDITSVASKLEIGDFVFVTVPGRPPGQVARENDDGRLALLREQLGNVAGQVSREDVETSNFANAVHKILVAAFDNAFSYRQDGQFLRCLQIKYADGGIMISVGGIFASVSQCSRIGQEIKRAMPFVYLNQAQLYEIQPFHITESERMLFDRATTQSDRRSSEHRKLKKLGFSDHEIEAYKDLIRYLPRYVETIV